MKWKNKAKRTATTTSAILLAIMLTACSDQGNKINSANNHTEGQQQEEQQGTIPSSNLPDETGVLDPGSLSGDDEDNGSSTGTNNGNGSTGSNGQANDNEIIESKEISAKGIYIGAADNTSVEIQVDNDYLVLRVNESLQHIINEYSNDQPVTFKYVEKTYKELGVTQNWLTSIELDK